MAQPPTSSQSPVVDTWTCPEGPECKARVMSVIIGLVLTTIAALATYYCLMHGLSMLDMASTGLTRFGSVALIYSGIVFSLVAVGNVVYTVGYKGLCHRAGTPFQYTTAEATYQIGFSILAPVVAIPAILCLGAAAALKGK